MIADAKRKKVRRDVTTARMETTTTTQKRAVLRNLAKDVQRNVYEMLKLASEILSDPEYVAKFGGEAQAVDDMQAKEFSHFGGDPPLASMIAAFRKVPDLKVWEEYRFNVRAIMVLAKPKEERQTGRKMNWKKRCEELEAAPAGNELGQRESSNATEQDACSNGGTTKRLHTPESEPEPRIRNRSEELHVEMSRLRAENKALADEILLLQQENLLLRSRLGLSAKEPIPAVGSGLKAG